MSIVPVIFEDHNLVRMRPLAWSTPVYELRCGMFSTRERIGLCSEQGPGILLGRTLFKGLDTASGWEVGPESLTKSRWQDGRFLFLNGMLAPDFSLISGLFELAQGCQGFVWQNENRLVAALLEGPQAAELGRDWQNWENSCALGGAWVDPAKPCAIWSGGDLGQGGRQHPLPQGGQAQVAAPDQEGTAEILARLKRLESLQVNGPAWIWDIVRGTRQALAGDLDFVKDGTRFRREPFGIFPAADRPRPDWLADTVLAPLMSGSLAPDVSRLVLDNPDSVFCAEGVDLAPGTALNTEAGPIILDRGVRVMPQCYLEGPLYIGPGSLVKPGTRIHGESSFGIVNRVAGEIGESTFGDFANKQHEGFIGHAVLGSWINLGAMTTCSDLKNNYGEIRVDLGSGSIATGQRFVGLLMGDHAKTAIGTLFNTGTCVGFSSNIFGTGMPEKYVGNFRWGGHQGCPAYAEERARETAGIVMGRRGCRFTEAHAGLFKFLS